MPLMESDDNINMDILKFKQVGEQIKKMKNDNKEALKSLEHIETVLETIAKKNKIKSTFTD